MNLTYRVRYGELKRNGIILGKKQPIYFDEGVAPVFATPSGKIELYSAQLAQAGFDPVPVYKRPPAGPPGYYRLLFGRTPIHSFSRTQSNHILMDMAGTNKVWVNREVAGRQGLRDGDYVRLRNQDGVVSNPVKVKVTERIRAD